MTSTGDLRIFLSLYRLMYPKKWKSKNNTKEVESMNLKPCRTFFLITFLVLSLQATVLFGQDLEPFAPEGIPPQSDYVYRQHYEQIQAILKSDLSVREKNLETFRSKLHKDAKAHQYMEAFFGQIVKDYTAAGQQAKADALTQKMMTWFPKSDALLPQQFKAAYDKKDWAAAIPLGEQLLQKSPNDAQLLVMLAESYRGANNTAKLMQISPKVISAIGPEKGFNYAFGLADYYRQQKNTARAIEYYDLMLQTYPTGTPAGWQASQWNSVKATAYQVKASSAWAEEDFGAVIQNYNEVLKLTPKNDGAHLFVGLAHWKLQQLDQAEAAFAKAVVLSGPNSARAQQYLETIYKPRNGDSLDGLDKVLAKAKSDLGI